MAKNETRTDTRLNPDQVMMNPLQTRRLAALANVDEKEISNRSVAELSETLKWRIDPRIFFFKRICGKVVKKDPVTGIEYPVPFATVYVEDTDCSFVTYQPKGYPWTWHFPFRCHREIIGTTTTDACGNFCVWVPRFDIDWVVRWRRERFCFPIIFRRPIIDDYIPEFEFPPKHGPGDPGPWERLDRLTPNIISSIAGAKAGINEEIVNLKRASRFGQSEAAASNILNKRVFDNEMPPPLPADFQKVLSGQNVVASKGASAKDAIRSSIGSHLGLSDATQLEGFDHSRFIGPFYRCIDVNIPVWQVLFDVPDITFRVTQDTNGDGVEENIYSEGYFDVRWDAGAIPNVKLVASSNAKESRACHVPTPNCKEEPAILFAGMMPLTDNNYFDSSTGYALRPNRPKTSAGVLTFPAQTPFHGALQLYGCVDVKQAQYYRIMKSTDGGSFEPMTVLPWNNYQFPTAIPIKADADGWYPINPINPVTMAAVPRASLLFPNLIMDWLTPGNENHNNILKIELGDGSKNHITDSAPVTIATDDTAPDITVNTLAWKFVGDSDATLRNLTGDCPMIKRGVIARDIEVVFNVHIAGNHFRDAALSTGGCGDGVFIPTLLNTDQHWYQFATDNNITLNQRYQLSSGSHPGCYSFSCQANSRTMNPLGAGGENLLPPDWYVEPVERYSYMNKPVAVVNEDL